MQRRIHLEQKTETHVEPENFKAHSEKMKGISENFYHNFMAKYHKWQLGDLTQDLADDGQLNKEVKVKDWPSEGVWTAKAFAGEDSIQEIVFDRVNKAYAKAIAYHKKMNSLHMEHVSEPMKINIDVSVGSLCDQFKFGTEPSLEQFLTFVFRG